MDKCERCHKEAGHFQSVTLTGENKQELLCMDCYNDSVAKSWGIDKPHSDFKPLTLLDSSGQSHTFYFSTMLTTGLGIKAYEVKDGHADFDGYQFGVLEHPETDSMVAFRNLYQKIKNGLSRKYLKKEPNNKFFPDRTVISKDVVIGRIEEKNDNISEINVIIDGKRYSWEELGGMLNSYVGFNFKLSIHDLADDIPMELQKNIRDKLYWLDFDEIKNGEDV